jgi:tetratricopeptide (TPR) repeat protein
MAADMPADGAVQPDAADDPPLLAGDAAAAGDDLLAAYDDEAAFAEAALRAAAVAAGALKTEGNAAFGAGSNAAAEAAYAAGLAALGEKATHTVTGEEPSAARVEAVDLMASLHVNRAAALLRLERRADAEAACSAALALQPENVKALYRRGLARAENPAGAVEDLKKALAAEPGNVAARRELQRAERRRAVKQREAQRQMKDGLRKASSLSLYGDKEAEKRARAKRQAAHEKRKVERHAAHNAARRARGEEDVSRSDFEKSEEARSKALAKDRERASEAAACARRDEKRRSSGGADDVVVVSDEGDLARGYKTTDDGRRTSYFSRTPDEESARLLAAEAVPQRLEGDAARAVSDSDGSAWNAAGTTFEERDMGTWCESALKARLKTAAAEADGVAVRATSITKMSGEASLVVSRGKARRIFEFAADVAWEARLPAEAPPGPGAATVTGTLRLPDISSAVAEGAYVSTAVRDAHARLSPARETGLQRALNAFAAAARAAIVAFVADYFEKKIR